MSRAAIRRLPAAIAQGIAAGEVIERPVSALKELIENALDAEARRIQITVRGGLEREFEVADDGTGIPRSEVALAFEPHATSKLQRLDDLERLVTLGFRGEALPAIGRAARVTLETRFLEEAEGTRLEVESGRVDAPRPHGRAPGTTVRVRDLFHDLPARRKFLRSSAGELRVAARLVSACALAHPEVAFRLEVDGRERLDVPVAADLRERVAALFGHRFLEQCLEAREERPGVCLVALLGVPELARLNRQGQTLLVNRRSVQSPLLSQALRHAYGNLIPPARHPAAILDLRLDSSTVDVNVHPTKREVRFSHDDRVFSFVSRCAAQPLSRLTPRYAPAGRTPELHPTLGELVREHESQIPLWGAGGRGRGGLRLVPSAPRTVGPAETGPPGGPGAAGEDAGEAGTETPAGPSPRFVNLWQLHDTYVLAPIADGLVIIDQHAAHERILYEEALERMRSQAATSQQVLFPRVLDLGRDEFEQLLELVEPLRRLGFDLAPISPPTVLVRGAPPGLGDRDPGELLRDLLDGLGEESGRQLPEDELTDRLAKSYACHAGVRAGQRLTLEEMNHLVDRLFATRLPHGDPHGRPTFVRVDLSELHARFGRSGPHP